MFTKMKRFGAFLMALVMVFSLLPTGVVLAEEVPPQQMSQAAYAEADLIFDQIDKSESAPAKKNATLDEKIADAMAVVMASDSYVEGSLVQNGDSFTWWTDDGIRCVYSPRMREINEDLTPEEGENEIVNEPVATKGGSPTGNQVYLIGPYYGHDDSFTNQYKNEAKRVAEAMGDTDGYTLYSGTAATVDKVAEAVANGAVVFFDSHGMTDYENSRNENDCSTQATMSYLCLTSTTGLTSEDYNDGALYYSDGICINGATIANHMTKNSPGGIVWMAICLGMATDTMCQPMREKGVEVVYGYSESVSFEGDYRFEKAFWDAMLDGNTVADSIAAMKAKWGNYDWSTQIANDYGSYDGYTSVREAQDDFSAFPVVVSDEDAYPGKRTTSSYGASSLQTVLSTYTLFTACDHIWADATCTVAATCTICGKTTGKPLPHSDGNGDLACDVCGKDMSVIPNSYIKVTEEPEDWSGQYLIVWEEGGLAFNGALSADQVMNGFSVTIEDDMIILDEADANRYFTIEMTTGEYAGYYTIKTSNGYFMGNMSGRNKVEYSTSYDYLHDLVLDADGSVLIETEDYSILRFNKTQDQMRFRYYKSSSYTDQQPVALYKLADGTSSGGSTGCSHNFGAGVTTTQPTCTAEGVVTYTCTLCGKTETGTVPALGHSWLNATCTAPKTCATCGATTGTTLTHADNNGDNACDTCGTAMGSSNPPAVGESGYVLITSADQLTDGQYVMIVKTGYAPGVYSNGWLTAVKPTVAGNVVTDTKGAVWTLTFDGSFVTLKDSNGVLIKPKSGNNNGIQNGSYNWAWSMAADGTVTFKGTGSDTTTLASNTDSSNMFRAYKNSTVSSNKYPCNFNLYKYVEITHEHEYEDIVTLAPTCTADGVVTYTCSCGDSYTEPFPALGHSYDNDSDVDCNVCGETREVGPAKDANLKFMSTPSLSFQDYIGIQLMMTKKLAGNYDKVYVEAVQVTPEGEVITTLQPILYKTNYYVFDQQIMAWSMTETVTLTLYAEKDGVIYVGDTYTASVESLALGMLQKYSANTTICRMLVDMLNYGAAVQTQFKHNAESLPNTQLGDFAAMGTTDIPICDTDHNDVALGGLTSVNHSVSMQAKVEIQVAIKNAVINKVTATIGEIELTPVLDTESIKGYTVIRVPIGATQLRERVCIYLEGYTYTLLDMPSSFEVACDLCVEAYAMDTITGSQSSVVIAIMRYGDSVKAYATK